MDRRCFGRPRSILIARVLPRLAHQLCEHLVELTVAREQAIAQAWGTRPEIAEATKARDEAQASVDELATQAGEHRKKTRARTIPRDLRAELKVARLTVGEAKARLREAKDAAYAAVAPALHDAGKITR